MALLKRPTARRTLTGLEIEPGGIRAVEVTAVPGGPLVVEREAGLRPEGIDLSAFAMVRSLAARREAPVLHIAVGGMVNLAVARDGECLFTRVIAGGFEPMAIDVAERTQVPVDEARAALA